MKVKQFIDTLFDSWTENGILIYTYYDDTTHFYSSYDNYDEIPYLKDEIRYVSADKYGGDCYVLLIVNAETK